MPYAPGGKVPPIPVYTDPNANDSDPTDTGYTGYHPTYPDHTGYLGPVEPNPSDGTSYSPPWDQPPPYNGSNGQNPSSGIYDDPTDTITRYPMSKARDEFFSFRQLPRRRRRFIIRKIFRR